MRVIVSKIKLHFMKRSMLRRLGMLSNVYKGRYAVKVSDVTRKSWSCVRCTMDAGSRVVTFIRDGTVFAYLKYTTLVCMRQ